MNIRLKSVGIIFASLALMFATGCSDDGPVTPVEQDSQPTGQAPPPGKEPTLGEEGP